MPVINIYDICYNFNEINYFMKNNFSPLCFDTSQR